MAESTGRGRWTIDEDVGGGWRPATYRRHGEALVRVYEYACRGDAQNMINMVLRPMQPHRRFREREIPEAEA